MTPCAPVLIPVRYRHLSYPHGIIPVLAEVPGHFDVAGVTCASSYSLHTEYSAGQRKFSSPALHGLATLVTAHRRGIPELWRNIAWAEEFAVFLTRVAAPRSPSVIEVHPPFRSYLTSVDDFLKCYSAFEDPVEASFPLAEIVLENRAGSRHGGRFLITSLSDILELAQAIRDRGLRLRIALDIPQLFTAELGTSPPEADPIRQLLDALHPAAPFIRTVHLWGRRRAAHIGTLDDLVGGRSASKRSLIEGMKELFGDALARYFVPEVNSSQADLDCIVQDLVAAGFTFANRGDSEAFRPGPGGGPERCA